MKLTIVALLSLAFSSAALADGFRCQSQDGIRVKLYNEVDPSEGTRNPAVLVVSERGVGTLAVLEGEELEKTITETSVTYEGRSNGRSTDGRFVGIRFTIAKQPVQFGALAGQYRARLTINADGESRRALLLCDRYLKHPQGE